MKRLHTLALVSLVLVASCGEDPQIDKVYNTVTIDAAASRFTGTLTQGVATSGANITLAYSNGLGKTAQVYLAPVNGLYSDTLTVTLAAATATSNGSGTPYELGTLSFEVQLSIASDTYSVKIPITVTGDITLHADLSSIRGTLVKGQAVSNAQIEVVYSSSQQQEVTFSAASHNGLSVEPYTVSLPAATEGTVSVPLTGTPTADGTTEIKVTALINETGYSMTLSANVLSDVPGETFTPETITYQGLTYNTIFIDVNNNGYVDPGDVWLDRNIGATSADPGSYGETTINAASVGQRLQYGKPYGATTFDASYTIDYAATGTWQICPDGYAVPTLGQFNAAIARVTGGTVSGNGVSGDVGITLSVLGSALRLPLCGWVTNGDASAQSYGTAACYWTSSEGSNTAPWKIDIHNNTASTTGANWADAAWQIPVRCVKQ